MKVKSLIIITLFLFLLMFFGCNNGPNYRYRFTAMEEDQILESIKIDGIVCSNPHITYTRYTRPDVVINYIILNTDSLVLRNIIVEKWQGKEFLGGTFFKVDTLYGIDIDTFKPSFENPIPWLPDIELP